MAYQGYFQISVHLRPYHLKEFTGKSCSIGTIRSFAAGSALPKNPHRLRTWETGSAATGSAVIAAESDPHNLRLLLLCAAATGAAAVVVNLNNDAANFEFKRSIETILGAAV